MNQNQLRKTPLEIIHPKRKITVKVNVKKSLTTYLMKCEGVVDQSLLVKKTCLTASLGESEVSCECFQIGFLHREHPELNRNKTRKCEPRLRFFSFTAAGVT